MTPADSLQRGRDAFGRRAWGDAYAALAAADGQAPLAGEDLERIATAAHLTGRDAESAELWARAHHSHQNQGDVERAARSAFWIAANLLDRGEIARASGWVSRGRRLLEAAPESLAQGYFHFLSGLQSFGGGDIAAAYAAFAQVVEIGERFGNGIWWRSDATARGGRSSVRARASRASPCWTR